MHIAGFIVSGVDLIGRLVTKSASIHNVPRTHARPRPPAPENTAQIELRLGHMAMSLYAYEAAIRGTLVGVKPAEFVNGAPMLDGAVTRASSR
jgi:hypothetical protein